MSTVILPNTESLNFGLQAHRCFGSSVDHEQTRHGHINETELTRVQHFSTDGVSDWLQYRCAPGFVLDAFYELRSDAAHVWCKKQNRSHHAIDHFASNRLKICWNLKSIVVVSTACVHHRSLPCLNNRLNNIQLVSAMTLFFIFVSQLITEAGYPHS